MIGLGDYLASFANRRWEPGTLDCGVFMADWVRHLCGRDPIADVRGTYSTTEEFDRIVEGEGGFIRACASRLRAVGFSRTRNHRAGDIAVVQAPFDFVDGKIRRRPTGAICVSDKMRAVITSDLGIVIATDDRLPMLRAWTLNA